MKLKKFGKVLLMGVLSIGVVFGVSSCVVSYTVGFLYVTSTVTAQPQGNGIITGYKIDHNTGRLAIINGLPVSSGGSNPVRAVLTAGSRFLYVLNRGATASGSPDCTTADPCLDSNITQFAVGGNGVLSPQQVFSTQGVNPFRLIADSSGDYLLALDHDSPDNYATSYDPKSNGCTLALGTGVKTCADVTVFQINQTTGRLSVVPNAQVTAASGAALTYFPVPANPVDFVMGGTTFLLTLSGTTPAASYPYTGGSVVFPYAYSGGQLTLSQNSPQPLNIAQGTAIVNADGIIYVLDNEPVTIPSCPTGTCAFSAGSYPSQILPFSVGSNGALQAETSGVIPGDPDVANPIYLILDSTGKFLYVANQGNNTVGVNADSEIGAYFVTSNPSYELTFLSGEPFGSGPGPQCIVEDPSHQFIYTANFTDSTVTGRAIDVVSGELDDMRVTSTYALQGPPTWCLVDGRTG